LAVCDELSDYHHIYTDGSKMNNCVAMAAVSREEVKSLRIPDKASSFATELVALNLALDIVWHLRHKKFVIFSDSLSCLLAIQNLQAESGYVMKFLKNYTALAKQFFFAGFLVTLVLVVMNKWMRWPKSHFILLHHGP